MGMEEGMEDRNKTIGIASLIVLAAIMGLSIGWSFSQHGALQRPLQEISEKDERFRGISAEARYEGLFNSRVLIFNLKTVSDPGKITPFLYLLEYAKKQGGRSFDRVMLQYRGKTKFLLEGSGFALLGTQAQFQKPEQTAMEFPPLLKRPNGLPAFQEPYGDEQWIAQKKLKNFRDFMFEWYIEDWAEEKARNVAGGKLPPRSTPSPAPEEETTGEPSAPDGETPGEPPAQPSMVPPQESPGDASPRPDAPSPSPDALTKPTYKDQHKSPAPQGGTSPSPDGSQVPSIEPEELTP
jgi:hypothetical protein